MRTVVVFSIAPPPVVLLTYPLRPQQERGFQQPGQGLAVYDAPRRAMSISSKPGSGPRLHKLPVIRLGGTLAPVLGKIEVDALAVRGKNSSRPWIQTHRGSTPSPPAAAAVSGSSPPFPAFRRAASSTISHRVAVLLRTKATRSWSSMAKMATPPGCSTTSCPLVEEAMQLGLVPAHIHNDPLVYGLLGDHLFFRLVLLDPSISYGFSPAVVTQLRPAANFFRWEPFPLPLPAKGTAVGDDSTQQEVPMTIFPTAAGPLLCLSPQDLPAGQPLTNNTCSLWSAVPLIQTGRPCRSSRSWRSSPAGNGSGPFCPSPSASGRAPEQKPTYKLC